MGEAGHYPLAALEVVRRRLVDDARQRLATAVSAADRLRERAEQAGRELTAATARLRCGEAGTPGTSPSEIEVHGRWVARLRREEQGALAARDGRLEAAGRAAALEDDRRAALATAEQQLRAVSRHRESWEAERRRAALAVEESAQDDLTSARASYRRT